MPITRVATGTFIGTTTNTITSGVPSGTAVGDMQVIVTTGKEAVTWASAPWWDTESGWTALGEARNGTTLSGVDVGSLATKQQYKVAGNSEATETMSGSWTDADPTTQKRFSFRGSCGSRLWSVDGNVFADSTLTGTTISCTGSPDITVTVGDMVLVCLFVKSNEAAGAVTSISLATTGVTYATQTYTEESTTAGGDMSCSFASFLATAGTASGASTVTATVATSGQSDAVASIFRCREVPQGGPVLTDAMHRSTRW